MYDHIFLRLLVIGFTPTFLVSIVDFPSTIFITLPSVVGLTTCILGYYSSLGSSIPIIGASFHLKFLD